MSIYIIKEPEYETSSWCKNILTGLTEEIKIKRIKYQYIETLSEFDDEITEEDVIVIIGSNDYWLLPAIQECKRIFKSHIIVLSNRLQNDYEANYNLVCSDIPNSMALVFGYLKQCKKERIALFGINENSLADICRADGFKQYGGKEENIFKNEGSLKKSCDILIKEIKKYDAVICANDYASVFLIKQLGMEAKKIFIIGYTDSLLARYVSPSVTSLSMNFKQFGKAAVLIYNMILKKQYISAVTIKIKWDLNIRRTTNNIPYHNELEHTDDKMPEKEDNFYNDPDIKRMMNIENMLEQCDDVDNRIIRCLLDGIGYIDISEKLYMSSNGIKYRVGRMVKLCDVNTKEELIKLLSEYLSCF